MKVDYKLLSKQKKTLVNVINKTKDKKTQEHLDGILHLIDGIEDKNFIHKGVVVLTND